MSREAKKITFVKMLQNVEDILNANGTFFPERPPALPLLSKFSYVLDRYPVRIPFEFLAFPNVWR
jgi:hypothetical protein